MAIAQKSLFIPAATADLALFIEQDIDKALGVNSVELPTITAPTVDVNNHGTINIPVPNITDSVVATINFSNITEDVSRFIMGNKTNFTVKWATSGQDTRTGVAILRGNEVYIEGVVKNAPGGSVTQASGVEAAVETEILVYSRKYNGQEVFFMDKLSGTIRYNSVLVSDELTSLISR